MDLSFEPDACALREMVLAARSRTVSFAADLAGEQWLGPRLATVNPPLWEIGHVGWFQEFWCLRREGGATPARSLLPDADLLYDSSFVPHRARWDLSLPGVEATLRYLEQTLARMLERIDQDGLTQTLAYYLQLAVFHEEMHNEAFTYTRQTLGYGAPRDAMPGKAAAGAASWAGDVEVAGGEFEFGAARGEGFVFDNEKWAHRVHVPAFRIARTPVTHAQFAAFVDDDGYRRRDLWCAAGWRWREQAQAGHPAYWRREAGAWYRRIYDRWEPLAVNQPVVHVNWYEADAYCRWSGRRLPTEAEWERAAATGREPRAPKRRYPWGNEPARAQHANLFGAAGDIVDVAAYPAGDSAWGCRQMFGNVWEWCADWFGPHPGFVRDPYKEYSEPWFGNHKVLRGGCFATRSSLLRATWRNFYTPERRDVFAGFRTCASAAGGAR